MKILISGSTGQLGLELRYISSEFPNYKFVFKTRAELDLSDENDIKSALRTSEYDYFINCAAYTNVDKAEGAKDLCMKVNAHALKWIGKHAPKSTKIIHISSDYVYHIDPGRPLVEDDATQPQGVYAQSKLRGEQELMALRPDSIIIRTSWVYSHYGSNFVKTMLKHGPGRAKSGEAMTVVSDQIGSPTYARDIARVLMTIISQTKNEDSWDTKTGIYNYSNEGRTTWCNFAEEIFKQCEIDCKVEATTTAAWGADAPRPLWSLMSKQKIKDAFGIEIRPWRESLQECLSEIEAISA